MWDSILLYISHVVSDLADVEGNFMPFENVE